MKKITAYEVGGEVYKNIKDAQAAETKLKERLERKRLEDDKAKLLAKVDEINIKLGCNTFKEAAKPAPKFIKCNRVEIIKSLYIGDNQIIKAGSTGTIVEDFGGSAYRVHVDGFSIGSGKLIIRDEDMRLKQEETGSNVSKSTPNFKVGDRVKSAAALSDTKYDGLEGTIVSTHSGVYDIKWEGKRWTTETISHGFVDADLELLSAKPKFKEGDRVRHIVQNYKDGKPYLGTIYGGSLQAGNIYVLWDGDGCARGCPENVLELVDAIPTKPKFKSGDKVRLTSTIKIASGKKIRQGTVTTFIGYYGTGLALLSGTEYGRDFYAKESEIELVDVCRGDIECFINGPKCDGSRLCVPTKTKKKE